ncbi:hypothetical protein L226DRAFT_502679 [Lentinus tigrinus ALCF2SS1-7]|uniref:uncharacterized protein n=1 Tax=Lentinus tigrinus ALCF2SS1-7 TaxID=1328758 RepID=UPI001165CFF8|nr:hypothetical protein L226DRAFT_502679 [Lentinus tigrinus ALCF2SS1-7]
MNFFDAYDVPGTTTPPTNQPPPSLNEEVTQVVGQLSRFWGGFRKQSQAAFETARKDFGDVVQQAQNELTKLTAEAPPPPPEAPEPNASPTEQAASATSVDETAAPSSSTSADARDTSDKAVPETSPSQSQTLFARLQSSLPPSLVNTVQTQLPESLKETLKHARVGSANLTALDFAQLRSTITTELHRVQGATEEYVHRSEEFLREAGEFLKDAVKVVPPEEGDSGYPGLIWDGTDVWMLPSVGTAESPTPGSSKGKGKERESSTGSGRPSVDTLRAVATRAESMLKQLRHDPAVIKVDPKDDENVREMYTTWLATEVASEDRGLGTTAWQNKVERTLADPVDGSALKSTMDTLVPETLTPEEFWTRYFFRVYQVEREEAHRRAIIQGTAAVNEDDFSWEDDDDDPSSPTTKVAPAQALTTASSQQEASPGHLSAPPMETKSRTSTPGNLSPRQSSEDSYDVVSSQLSSDGAAETATLKPKKQDEEDEEDEEEGDEDEEDEEDEDEDGEEEEEDSDWE